MLTAFYTFTFTLVAIICAIASIIMMKGNRKDK